MAQIRSLKITALLLVPLLCLGLLTGCGGDTLIVQYAVEGNIGTIDPQFAQNSTSALVAANVFEPLLVEDPDGGLHPGVAESYTVSADGRTYTFSLREDACWSDGSGVTAGDFVFALQRMFQSGSISPYAENFSSVRNAGAILSGEREASSLGVRAVDEHTLVVELEQPDSSILSVLAQWYSAPCKQSFFEEQKGKYGLGLENTLYNGPYVVSRLESGSEVRLRQNPNYHSEQPALLYGVNITLNTEDPAAAFAQGENDLYQLPEGTETRPEGADLVSFGDTTYLLVLNIGSSLLGEDAIRLALCAAIDREAVAAVLEGGRSATRNIVPEAAVLRSAGYRETVGDLAGLSLSDPRTTFREALASVGETKLPFTELLVPDTTVERRAAGIIQGCWQNTLGASINVMPLEQQELMQRVTAGDYDIALIPVAAGGSPLELLERFAPETDQYSTGWQSEEYAQALDVAAAESDSARLAARVYAAEQLLADSGVVFPLYGSMSHYAVSDRLTDVWIYGANGLVYFKYVQEN